MALAWPHVDEDGTAIAQHHHSEVRGTGGEGLLVPRGGGDVQHCSHNEDVGEDDEQHGGQHKGRDRKRTMRSIWWVSEQASLSSRAESQK